jgi:hypothetical protein
MATDVARLSFERARFYRGVAPQQGRVSLEAEQNEQRVIDSEERRKELLDIVGPAGTPDDGYLVTAGQGFDLTVGPGTMYVGGWRVELDEPLDVADQPDWLEAPPAPSAGQQPTREHVVLWLQDTDVTAVEDSALYDAALGGPDGAARTRLLQRVKRIATEADNCADALAGDIKQWKHHGLTFDPTTMELQSQSRLQVSWEGDPQPPDPCEPSSTGGYLGAENQCIRVQVTAFDAAKGTFDFLWGYDDASFLYRVSADAATNPGPVLTLDRAPVDDYHRPRAGQAVQLLRATAQLASNDGVVEGYVAAPGGQPAVLGSPYDPDTKTVQFPAPLPPGYTDPPNPRLYLRVWEEWVRNAVLDQPITLAGTGMAITITSTGQALNPDDFWCIAVRPATPTTVYPDRYLRTPQPPDGPHQWVCPLAVIDWPNDTFTRLEDCRKHFPPIVDIEAGGCCTIDVRASDAARLQELIDAAADGRAASNRGSRINVCFQPGRYELTTPLKLLRKHSNLTLHGCNDAVILAVAAGHEAAFGQGMLQLLDVDNVTISGFEFTMPQVPATIARAQATTTALFNRTTARAINASVAGDRFVSIAIRTLDCAVVEIERCLFRFSLGEHATSRQTAQTMPRNVFGVAVFAAGGIWGLRLNRNRFLHDPAQLALPGGEKHLLAGFVHAPAVASRADVPKPAASTTVVGPGLVRATLDDAVIVDNEFHGIAVAVAVFAKVIEIRFRDNLIKDCYGGVWILDLEALVKTDLGKRQVSPTIAEAVGPIMTGLAATVLDPVLVQLFVVATLYPLPHGQAQPRSIAHVDVENLATLREHAAQAQRAFMSALDERIAADQPGPASAQAAAAPAPAKTVTTADFTAVDAGTADTNLRAIVAGLTELVAIAGFPEQITTSVRVERNSIDCALPAQQTTGSAVAILLSVLTRRADIAAVSVDANRLVSRQAKISAGIFGGATATVNGNTIIGATDPHLALDVRLVAAVAIVGNVIVGTTQLPGRSLPAPFDKWPPFNTVVP